MRTTSPLPVAPRPFDGELLSSWQARVACHYGRTAAELELWLDPSSGPDIGGFERRDFDPDEIGQRDITTKGTSEISMRNQFRAWKKFMLLDAKAVA